MHSRSLLLAASLGVFALACSDDDPGLVGPPPVEPDGVPPVLSFGFPVSAIQSDLDGDGLVDIEITWHDDAGVDPTSFRLGAIPDSAVPSDTIDVGSSWQVVELTASGVRLEETVAGRLGAGTWMLRATVSDSTGTPGTALSVPLPLPRFTLVESTPVGWLVGGLSYCPAREEVYVHGWFMAVVDAETFEVRERINPGSDEFDEPAHGVACAGDAPLALTAPHLRLFDVETMEWAEREPVPDLLSVSAIAPLPGSDRFIANGYFHNDSIGERRLFVYDPVSAQITSTRTEEGWAEHLAEIDGDLFMAGSFPHLGSSTLFVIRDWRVGAPSPQNVAGALGDLVDLDVLGDSVITLAVQDDGSHVVITNAATGSQIGSWWLADVHLYDVAVAPDGNIFAPASTICLFGEECDREPLPAYLLRSGGCGIFAECIERVPLPDVDEVTSGEQAAFRADGAYLFWVADAPPELKIFLSRP